MRNKRAENYDVGTLENKVVVESGQAEGSISKLIETLDKLTQAVNKSLNATESNKLDKNAKKAENSLEKILKNSRKLKATLGLGTLTFALKKGFNIAKDLSKEYIDMVETNNLFEVAMGKVVDEYGNLDEASSEYYLRAMKFQDEMNEKLATNRAEMQKYQAMYYTMLTSQGIDKENSYKMSESLTKAGYDIASLYNLEVDKAMSKLQSGLSGQPKALRELGIDISASSLETVLGDLGISRSVEQLSYAEKEVARYIAILQQAGKAQGDFAKTFENPANQLKVFKNQLIELKQVAGSFIVNSLGGILVYANAIIMAIKEILKFFATLFGYDLSSGGAVDLNDATGAEELADNLGTAGGNAKKLKNILMGFDEINNITLPSSSGSGGGSSSNGGIDQKLLDALDEWDNKMKNLNGKAQELRDKMLEWLGFERDDEKGWKLKEGLTNFEKILDVVKAIGLAILTWKVSHTVTRVVEALGGLSKVQALQMAFGITLLVTGIYLMYKGIKHILEGDIDIFSILETLLGSSMGVFGLVSILKMAGLGKVISLGSQIKFAISLAVIITSMAVYFDALSKIENGEVTAKNILQGVAASIGAAVGVGILTMNIPLSVTLGLGLISFTLTSAMAKKGRQEMWYPLRRLLDVTEKNNYWIKEINFVLDIGSFTIWGMEKIFGDSFTTQLEKSLLNSIKKMLLSIADIVKGWGWIGQGISTAIKSGISEFEKDTTDHIESSVKRSITNAQIGIDGTAENSGIRTMTMVNQGLGSRRQEIENTIRNVQNDSLILARETTKTTAENSGTQIVDNISNGINSKTESLKTTLGSIQNNSIINSRGTANSNARVSGEQIVSNLNSGLDSRIGDLRLATGRLNNTVSSKLSEINTYNVGAQVVNGVASGINDNKNNWNMWNALSNLKDVIVNGTKRLLGIHSPSKVMADIAKYIPLGVAEGIDSESDAVYSSIAKLNEGIQVSTKDASIDATSYVDYGTISGDIKAQSNVAVSNNIVQGIAQAVSRAMQQNPLNVNIEARTEEGVIVERASEGFRQYVRQTGELPFPVPVN